MTGAYPRIRHCAEKRYKAKDLCAGMMRAGLFLRVEKRGATLYNKERKRDRHKEWE